MATILDDVPTAELIERLKAEMARWRDGEAVSEQAKLLDRY